MNLSQLSNHAIHAAGDLYYNVQSGRSFKGLSSGPGSNTIRINSAEPVDMGDVLQSRTGNYFVTDLQNDNACKIVSIFKITHQIVNDATEETILAHLGEVRPPQGKFPAQAIFWVPSRYPVAIGDRLSDNTTTCLIAQVRNTGNNGNAVYADIIP